MRYDKQCWSCGKNTMVLKGDYYQCSECGATWNEQPSLGIPPVVEIDARTGRSPQFGKPTDFRPHGTLVRQAKRKREQTIAEAQTPDR